MDERKIQAWKEIAERTDDPLAPAFLTVSRSDLSELVNELIRLRHEAKLIGKTVGGHTYYRADRNISCGCGLTYGDHPRINATDLQDGQDLMLYRLCNGDLVKL